MNKKQRKLLKRAKKILDWWYCNPLATEKDVYRFAKSIGIENPVPAPLNTLVLVVRNHIRETLGEEDVEY